MAGEKLGRTEFDDRVGAVRYTTNAWLAVRENLGIGQPTEVTADRETAQDKDKKKEESQEK